MRSHADGVVVIAAAGAAIPGALRMISELPQGFGLPVCLAACGAPCFPQKIDLALAPPIILDVHIVEDGEYLEAGNLYLAPPARTLQVTLCKRVVLSGRLHDDHVFVSAAETFGRKAILIVLSGCSDYGVEVVALAKSCGATIIVEDPSTAANACMPEAAIGTGCADYVLPIEEMASKLQELTLLTAVA
jgi:two-component system chemotaxis response regulator CheB